MNRKVLIVAYWFPPFGGGGVQRTVKFVKFLQAYGWDPVVLTVKAWGLELRDNTMLKEIPKNVRVYRTISFEPIRIYQVIKRIWSKNSGQPPLKDNNGSSTKDLLRLIKDVIHLLSIPDTEIGWLPFAVLQGKKIIETENIECIYSSSGPPTCHLIALCLKQWTNLPWVADFRDPWTQHQFASYRYKTRLRVDESLELMALKTADKLLTVTQAFADGFSQKYNQVPRNKFKVITNGYDADDFSKIPSATEQKNRKFTIVHTGSFLGLRTPKFFLNALKLLLDETPSLRKDIEVIFAGRLETKDKKVVCDLGLEDVVKLVGYVSHQEALLLLSNSDVILLILASVETGVYPGKIFEYLAVGRPVLALVPQNGIAAELIEKSKTGAIVDSEQVTSIKDAICRMYERYKDKTLTIHPDLSVVEQYERKRLTRDLAATFNQVLLECFDNDEIQKN
jgi:glycosyltransferase involved in cell wall biosynthesis